MGIRRISMGIQTVSPRLLAHVGRTATSIAFDRLAVDNVRAAGFTRFNVDVMYGFAHQSSKNVEATLQHAIQLQPDTITLYRMRYKGTRIADQATHVSLEEVNSQANLARAMLLAHGYGHPTYDAPGKNTFSRLPDDPGTSDYLTERVINGTPYLGLGLGAQSLSQKSLSYNSGAADKRLDHYRRQIQADQLPLQDLYHLSLAAAMGKMISVSFYFGEINLQSFANKFGISLESAFPKEIRFLLENGLMAFTYQTPYSPTLPAQEGEPVTLRLTQKGCDQVNGVIALFYAGAIKAYLLDRVRKDVRLCQSSVLRAM
jgi:oxygen-independent coproporphyrinogen-3 oxidase